MSVAHLAFSWGGAMTWMFFQRTCAPWNNIDLSSTKNHWSRKRPKGYLSPLRLTRFISSKYFQRLARLIDSSGWANMLNYFEFNFYLLSIPHFLSFSKILLLYVHLWIIALLNKILYWSTRPTTSGIHSGCMSIPIEITAEWIMRLLSLLLFKTFVSVLQFLHNFSSNREYILSIKYFNFQKYSLEG